MLAAGSWITWFISAQKEITFYKAEQANKIKTVADMEFSTKDLWCQIIKRMKAEHLKPI